MEFEMSPTVGAIADALAKAQGAIEGAKKESENPAFKRDGKAMRYADLASVWDACRAQLSANGVAVVQSPGEAAEGKISVTTLLAHSSGEWFKGYLTIPLSKVDAHGYGSATTYARRYALAAMVGVAPEDDDGNAAIKPGDDAAPNNGRRTIDAPANGPSRPRPAPLTGKHKTRAAARQAYGEIVRELHSCGDSDMLESCLLLYKDDLDQFRDELPEAWNGDGADFIGMAKEIENARARVSNMENGI